MMCEFNAFAMDTFSLQLRNEPETLMGQAETKTSSAWYRVEQCWNCDPLQARNRRRTGIKLSAKK